MNLIHLLRSSLSTQQSMGTVKGILELFCPGFVAPSLKYGDAESGEFCNLPNIQVGLGIKSWGKDRG